MANNLDLFKSKLSGNPLVDGLIWQDHLPYAAEYPFKNYINFSFDTSLITDPSLGSGTTALTDTAKQAVRNALAQANQYTGIFFNEVANGVQANTDLVIALKPLGGATLSQDTYTCTYNPNAAQKVDISDVILINSNSFGVNSMPPGSFAYQGLLHEIGHALGLREPDTTTTAFPAQYNTGSATMMAQNNYSTFTYFSGLDAGAFKWLYSMKGLQNPGIVPSGDASSTTLTVLNQNTMNNLAVNF